MPPIQTESSSCARNEADHHPHRHRFSQFHPDNERRTMLVVVLTLLTMVVEISVGLFSGSMALLSDGWHMGTHAAALGIAWFAYRYTRKNADSKQYTFGTGKVGILGAYTSAIILGITGILIIQESVERFLSPVEIQFGTAITVAIIGLVVNLACVLILGGHHHEHKHEHGHKHQHSLEQEHEPGHEHPLPHPSETTGADHNYRAALVHVLADALTSILAIAVLLAGWHYGLTALDPLAGFFGATLILLWAWSLMRQTSRILLDCNADPKITDEIHKIIEANGDATCLDLHVWRVSEEKFAVILSILAQKPQSPEYYREKLGTLPTLAHITIEVHQQSPAAQSKNIR